MSQHIIKLTIATVDQPGKPIPLDDEAIKKMASIPPVLRRLAKIYRSKLRSVEIMDAEIVVTIDEEADLVEGNPNFVEDLVDCAQRVTENAQSCPPRPLKQVTSDPASVDLLKTLSREGHSTGLRLTMETSSGSVELPCLPLEVFTEPDQNKNLARSVSAHVIGVCLASPDAHTVVLGNQTQLELPYEHYPVAFSDLLEQVFIHDCRFSGSAEVIRAGVLRALPGGSLTPQLRLDRDDIATDGWSPG